MTSYESDGTAWGMGPSGGMRRSEDVVRDDRSALWKNHPSGRGDGTGSTNDVSPLPRHFSVPKLGDDFSRSGVRSRRRRDDTGTEMGGETMNVHQVAGYHREACVTVYKQHGRINPRLWCESREWFAIIDPVSWDSLRLTDWQRTIMLTATVKAIDGHMVGRCDEMLFRYGFAPEIADMSVSYEEMRDYDPSIRSGLVVHALDCKTTESYMTMATFDLDSEGLPFWEQHDGQYHIPSMTPLWATGRLLKEARKRKPVPFEEAEEVCSDNGWLVTFLNKWENGIA